MSRSYRTVGAVVLAVLAMAASSYAAPAKVKAHSIVGTLQKVDGQTITVQTTKGAETVMLMPSSRISRGATTIQAANLSTYSGQRIKVRYVDKNGEKDAQTVTITSAATKTVSAAKPVSKPVTNASKK